MVNQQAHRLSFAGFAITFLGAVLFSTKAIFVKKAFTDTHIDALSLLTLRMVFSLPFYVGTAIFAGSRKRNKPFTRRQWLAVVVLGLFGYYISSFLDFAGLQYVSAGLERLILFLYPTFAVLINAMVFKQVISRRQVLALLLTYTGIAIAYIGQLQVDTGNAAFLHRQFVDLCLRRYLCHLHCGQWPADTRGRCYQIYGLCHAGRNCGCLCALCGGRALPVITFRHGLLGLWPVAGSGGNGCSFFFDF